VTDEPFASMTNIATVCYQRQRPSTMITAIAISRSLKKTPETPPCQAKKLISKHICN